MHPEPDPAAAPRPDGHSPHGGRQRQGSDATSRVTLYVRGRVQGVGFRWWVRAQALELGLAGHARNTDDGRVEVVAEGTRTALENLIVRLEEYPSTTRRPGTVERVSSPMWSVPRGTRGFLER